jgi:hypothetical protein
MSALQTDLSGRRIAAGPATLLLPVFVFDRTGKELIGKFKSPRRFARAVISGSMVLVDGDRVVIERAS